MAQNCRICKNEDLISVLDFGPQYLSDFRDDESKPDKFPLNLVFCPGCSLIQLDQSADRNLMYHDGYGYRSGTNELIKENLAWIVEKSRNFVPSPKSWLDIACNDGTLLGFVGRQSRRVGIDPVKKFLNESSKNADLIISDFFPSPKLSEQFDVITSISMFYDLDEPLDFIQDISQSLRKGGIWIVQQNYLVTMLENLSFDNICHEHVTYYSLTSMHKLLSRSDLEIIDVDFPSINGGSLMTVIARRGDFPVSSKVGESLDKERNLKLDEVAGYQQFKKDVLKNIDELGSKLDEIGSLGKSIQIYGASTRGGTIWQALGDHIKFVSAAVERQNEKVGKFYSVIGKKIISEAEMRNSPPDYLLIGPWFLKNSFLIREKSFIDQGGAMIFPIPTMLIIDKNNYSEYAE